MSEGPSSNGLSNLLPPTCDTPGHRCRYAAQPSVEEPCKSCDGHRCWTPEESEPPVTAKVERIHAEIGRALGDGPCAMDERERRYYDRASP